MRTYTINTQSTLQTDTGYARQPSCTCKRIVKSKYISTLRRNHVLFQQKMHRSQMKNLMCINSVMHVLYELTDSGLNLYSLSGLKQFTSSAQSSCRREIWCNLISVVQLLFSLTHVAQIQVPHSCSIFSLFLPGFVRSCFAAARLLSEEHDWYWRRRGWTSSCCLIGCSRWFHAHFVVVNNSRSVRKGRCFVRNVKALHHYPRWNQNMCLPPHTWM